MVTSYNRRAHFRTNANGTTFSVSEHNVEKKFYSLTKKGDEIQVRNRLFLSHTYDHRIVDGALGGKFAQKVAENIENFDLKSNIS